MNKTTEQAILGSMCGDGYIRHNNPRYEEVHSIKQRDYMLWKADILSNLNPRVDEFSSFDKRYDKYYDKIRMLIFDKKLFSKFRSMFYVNDCGYKTISEDILDKINELGLAVWYMDDGCYHYENNIVSLYSRMHDIDSQYNIQRFLKNRFNIECIVDDFYKYKYIRLNRESTDNFLNIVRKYVPECMNYKLGLDFDRKSNAKIINRDAKKKWKDENSEHVKEWSRIYYLKNKERIDKQHKEYYDNNRDSILSRQKHVGCV